MRVIIARETFRQWAIRGHRKFFSRDAARNRIRFVGAVLVAVNLLSRSWSCACGAIQPWLSGRLCVGADAQGIWSLRKLRPSPPAQQRRSVRKPSSSTRYSLPEVTRDWISRASFACSAANS